MALDDVVITGVHTGLGRGIAAACLDAGARVVGLSRQAPADLLGHERLRFAPLDLRRPDDVGSAVAAALRGIDRLDLVVLNAGVLGEIKSLRDTTLEEIRDVMDVNVWANKALIDALLDGSRRVSQVVAISSGAAFNGSGGWGPYSISKSALNLLVRVYAHEAPETHFVSLAPGLVDTAMTRAVAAAPDDPLHEANARIRAAFAEGRVQSPDEAARAIVARLEELRTLPTGSFADMRTL